MARLKARLEAKESKNQIPTGPEDFAEYVNDPIGFANDVLGCRLWPKQEEILLSLTTEQRIAVRSGQKCGKSRIVIIAVLWFVCCHKDAKVIMTAPTGRQVREILWHELRNVCNKAIKPLGASPAKTPAGGMRFPDGRQVIGFSVTDTRSEDMAGTSGAALMYVIDEASGFSQTIFEAIEGNLGGSPMGRLMIISNPTQPSGFFFDAFHRSADFWKKFTISSEEASLYADKFPGLMRADTIRRQEKDKGRDSQWFRIRILGQFPSSAINSVISLADVDASKERFLAETLRRFCVAKRLGADTPSSSLKTLSDIEIAALYGPKDGPLEFGADVARFGDDSTVIRPRRGEYLLPYRLVHGFDTQEVAGAVAAMVRDLAAPNEVALVKVDGIGYGAGVVDALRRVEFQSILRVIDVNVSKTSDDPERFPNLRSQLWFAITEFLRGGGCLHDASGDEDGKLDAELLTPTYKIDPQGRQVVEPKADTKQRLGRSPDRADATALAIYNAQIAPVMAPIKPPVQTPSRWGSDRGF
jgi:hypothetical protein